MDRLEACVLILGLELVGTPGLASLETTVNDKSPQCREPCLSSKSLNSHSDFDNYITSPRPFLHLQNREKQKNFSCSQKCCLRTMAHDLNCTRWRQFLRMPSLSPMNLDIFGGNTGVSQKQKKTGLSLPGTRELPISG